MSVSVWPSRLRTAEPSSSAPSWVATTQETIGEEALTAWVAGEERADDSLSVLDAPVLTFDLVVATLGRTHELDALLGSLERQTHQAFRVLVVDQNEDDRVAATLGGRPGITVVRLRSEPGLSRARNAALVHVEGDVVGFPDDDCSYPPDLLERIAARLAERPDLDGVTGLAADAGGHRSDRWPAERCPVTVPTVWNRVNSHTLFLRRHAVEQAGRFDESLGLGSLQPWHSGEETDFVIGALQAGARIEYDPSFLIVHPQRRRSPAELRALGARDGASVGFILRKRRYPLAHRGQNARAPSWRRRCFARPRRCRSRAVPSRHVRGPPARLSRPGCGYPVSVANSSACRSSQGSSAKRSTARARARTA